jgi:hypothetical protein
VIALGREGFLTASETIAVLRKLADAQAPVTLDGVTAGALSLDEQADSVTVFLSGEPVCRLDPGNLRGGWCSAPSNHANNWNINIDLHGEGCQPLAARLRFRTTLQINHPRLRPILGRAAAETPTS